jgi:putative permease
VRDVSKSRHQAQTMFFSVLMLSLIAFVVLFPRLSFPLASAYVLSLAIRPLQGFYQAAPISRRYTILAFSGLTVALLAYPLFLATASLPHEISEFLRNTPRIEMLMKLKSVELRSFLFANFGWRLGFDPVDVMFKKLQNSGDIALIYLPRIMGSLLEWSLLTPLFLWFLLKDGPQLKTAFLRVIPNAWFERGYMLFHQFNGRFGDYITAKTIEALLLGFIVGVGLWLIDFPYATLLGVVAGVTNILPYVGPLLGWVLAVLVGALQPSGTVNMAGMNVVFLLANLIDMALVFPLLVSKIVNLHPLVVVSSVVMGSQVAGVGGMLVSVPVAAFLKLLLIEIHRSLYSEKI